MFLILFPFFLTPKFTILNKDTVQHNINISFFQYSPYLKNEGNILTLRPTNNIKFSLKVNTNKVFFDQMQSIITSGDFVDIITPNFRGGIGYDFRIKYKVNNELGIITRYQSTKGFQAFYLGVSLKIEK